MKVKYYCPVSDWSCPYYKSEWCSMYDEEGTSPFEECDAFYGMDEEELEYCIEYSAQYVPPLIQNSLTIQTILKT